MLLSILGFIDLLSGIILFLTVFNIGYGFPLLFVLAIIIFVKGLYSLAANSKGAGAADIVAAILLTLTAFSIGLYYVLSILFGIYLVIKGLQSIFSEALG